MTKVVLQWILVFIEKEHVSAHMRGTPQDVLGGLSSTQHQCWCGDVFLWKVQHLCFINQTANTEVYLETLQFHLLSSILFDDEE